MKAIASTLNWVMQGKSGVAATIQTTFFQIVILATNILTGMVTARILGSEGRGELAAINLWPNLIGQILALGLGPSLLYNLKKYPTQAANLYGAVLVLGTLLGALGSAIGVGIIPMVQSQYSLQAIRYAQLFVLTTPISLLTLILLNAYRARGLFSVVNQTNYLSPILTLGLLGGFAGTRSMTPLTGALAYRIPFLSIFIWKFVDLWRHYRPGFRNLRTSIGLLLPYAWRSAGINILSQVADRLDQVLVVGYLDPDAMGLYVVALSVSRMLSVFQSAIVTVLFPKTAARPISEVVDLAGRAARVNIWVSVCAAVPLMILGPMLLPFLYGPEFQEAVTVFQILSLEIIVKGTTLIIAQVFMAVGRPGIVTLLQGVGVGLSFPLMFWLIPRFGLLGAGVALLTSTTARLLFILICFPWVLKVDSPSLIPRWSDLQILWRTILRRSQPQSEDSR
ncbi:lipopolysaccharide biosynthesis protein [Lyngbya confervoides]|uniref:Polysaccharide biosynthesis C-terminal domain-containing protein n=1 Tax=Lyngbya confervoides BDU141951 TaxID=1574623 RepID=A0ABD4SZE9_9CYAN|nr:polysaccharide biosynthesis C-terminal domain-containing protein [Lyngbya confervoides]MCM1981525.1 polysaccharide biosynthesis C-terminal domain-containing protein [Lyngbya confervoides BDU141951]